MNDDYAHKIATSFEVGDQVSVRIKINRGCYWQAGVIDKPETNGMYRVEFYIEVGGRKKTHGWYKTKDIKPR
jgi:hypothetical protein